ncbi:MAG: hypothetical protein ACKOPI_01440, partial [bacterium]
MDGSDTEAMAARGEKTLQILTSGQQWLWRYQYPDGTFSYYELVLPVGQPVEIELESTDVLHRWWVPGLSQKADAVPGKTHVLKFTPDTEGTFEGASYAFSGANYATMRTVVRVVSQDEFERWLDEQGAEIADAQKWVQDEIARNGPYGAIEEAGDGQCAIRSEPIPRSRSRASSPRGPDGWTSPPAPITRTWEGSSSAQHWASSPSRWSSSSS